MGTKKTQPVQFFWALYDSAGKLFSVGYDDPVLAEEDAVGPRFYRGYTVRCYELVRRKNEPTKKHLQRLRKKERP